MSTHRRLATTSEEAAEQLRDDLNRHGLTLEQWNQLWTPGALARRRAQHPQQAGNSRQ